MDNQKTAAWQASASITTLKQRAKLLETIRIFFKTRDVLDVETPLLSNYPITDPHLENLSCTYSQASTPTTLYLQTSPEYYMKRLLASGSGCIYQITKAFRQDPVGRYHQPEFTMLEWYRVGFSHHQLMDELAELLSLCLSCPKAKKISYRELFISNLAIDPFKASLEKLRQCAIQNGIHLTGQLHHKDDWLALLMSHCIEPNLAKEQPVFVYDYPVSQASLAKINQEKQVAERFELYYQGVELANGFHELRCANEQKKRFEADNTLRQKMGLPLKALDVDLLSALETGLPQCSGVALGLDRLMMLAFDKPQLNQVVSFAY